MSAAPKFRLLADGNEPAAALPPGVSLLEASAGTGKTWTLTHLVLRELLADPLLRPDQVLVVTFTNAAVEELSGRLRAVIAAAVAVLETGAPDREHGSAVGRLVGQACARFGTEVVRLLLATLVDSADLFAIATLHGWCNRMLDVHARECGALPGAALLRDDLPMLEEAVRDAWRIAIAGDALMAAAADRWSPGRRGAIAVDVGVVKLWRQSPGTAIVPADADVSGALAALRTALAASAPGVAPALTLAGLGEVKDGKLPKPVREALTRLRRAWLAWLCPWAQERTRAAVRAAGARTSDGILGELAAALAGPGGPAIAQAIRARTRLALVDEFQDTDPLQWRILRTVFAGSLSVADAEGADASRLVLIGDPKQAIYGFRGGDLPTYLAASATAAARWRLGDNHRTCAALLKGIDELFAINAPFAAAAPAYVPSDPTGQPGLESTQDDGAALRWWVPEAPIGNKDVATLRIAQSIISEVNRLMAAGATFAGRPLHHGDVAVLVREHHQARSIQEQLRRARIPAVLADAGDLLAAPAVQDLAQVLAAMADPSDRVAVRRALATVIGGCVADDLGRDDPLRDEAALTACARLRQRWQREGIAAAIATLLATGLVSGQEPPLVRIARRGDGERWLTDLRHVGDWLAQRSQGLPADPVGILRLLAGDDEDDQERRLHLAGDHQAVRLVTMHACKGLEWPVVFCPYLWTSRSLGAVVRVPGAAGSTRLVLDGTAIPEAEHQRLAEDLRLTYVALTRAKARCYVAWGAFGAYAKESAASALGWLLADHEPPKGVKLVLDQRVAQIGNGWARRFAAAGSLWGLQAATETAVTTVAASPATDATPVGEVLTVPAVSLRTWTTTSFTRITAGHDAPPGADDPQTAAAEPDTPADPTVIQPGAGLALLARGAAAGVALHALLEHHDWSRPAEAPAIIAVLQRHALADPEAHHGIAPVPVLADLLDRLATLDLGGWRLAETSSRRSEWRFVLPLESLRASELAGLFARHGSARAREAAPALVGLGAQEVRGLLSGSIDLLVEAAGAWHLVDWKTNHLADDALGYPPERCWRAMREAHYVLQYHLYALAVRRWRRRFAGPELPIRATYVFLRGVPAGLGVVSDRPEPALLDALDAMLQEPAC